MTSHDTDGTLVAIGWRDGLRVVSELVDLRGRSDHIVEPGILLMEEADWHRQLAGQTGQPRFHAGQSRTWVDPLVSHWNPKRHTGISERPSTSGCHTGTGPTGRRTPRLRAARARSPQPRRRRVVCLDQDGIAERDLRAISERALASTGDIVVSIIDEADWYLWRGCSYSEPHPSLRTVSVDALWVET